LWTSRSVGLPNGVERAGGCAERAEVAESAERLSSCFWGRRPAEHLGVRRVGRAVLGVDQNCDGVDLRQL
jgi:hypothetical protein